MWDLARAEELAGSIAVMRRILGRVSRRFRGQYGGARVAVVIAASDEDTTRIGPLIETLRGQTHRNLDIIVALWGHASVARANAQRHAEEDWRVRVSDAAPDAAAALSRARLGAARYVLAPRGGDLLPRDAIARLVAALEGSGSAAAIGRVAIPRQGYAVATTALGLAHRTERLGVTLAEAPDAVTDLTLGSRLFRRSAWTSDAGGHLPGLATTFDLLPEVTYRRTGRRDDVVFGTRPHTLAGLDRWWTEQQRIAAAIEATGNDEAPGWWRWSLLDTHLQAFVDDAERATPEQWQLLRAVVAELLGTDRPLPARIGAEAAIKLRLIQQDRLTDLADLVFARTFAGGDQPTRAESGAVIADLPVPADVPGELLRMSEAETPLMLDVRGLRRVAGRTSLDVVAWIDHLDLPERPELDVTPFSDHAQVGDVEVVQRHDITANHGDRRPCHDVAHGAFTLTFATPEDSSSTARFNVTLTSQGVTRTAELAVDLSKRERMRGHGRRALADDEIGPFHQRRLQEWAATTSDPIEPDLFYLQSYSGQHATDSQRALHDELRRRFPYLRLLWGVKEADVPLPDGATGVVIGSRDWYRTMATARFLCLNTEPDRWFRRREGQLLLQTFHGYPAKAMGVTMWQSKGLSERRIAWELERVTRNWSLILAPTEEMAEHYRRQYRYDGPILSVGYPRDDALRSPGAPQVRERVRRELGIASHEKAVLYAPTWRDDLATAWRSAEAALHLDITRAARELGSEYVLLLRGHRFHQLHQVRAEGARILDVTSHGEVNELILAADAAVVDYSSIRFDLAFAGVPQVFLVPDLDTYGSSKRGFLYPFTDTTPGPVVTTTDEVVAELRDVDGLRDRTAAAIRAFNERYQPWQDDGAARRVVDELESRWGLGR